MSIESDRVPEVRQDRRLPEIPVLPRAWSVPAPGGRSVGGVRLGDDDGRRALFVHGVPGSSENVRFLDLSGRSALAAGVSLVAIDRPGIGYTTPGALRDANPAAAAAAAADDMAHVLDELDWPLSTVIVHSAGAYAGVTMAIRHPDRVARLVLVAAAAPDMGADASAAMDDGARAFFDLCRDRPGSARWVMRAMRLGLGVAPGPATRAAARSLPPSDRALLADPRASAAFVAMVRHAGRLGARGVVADGRAARGPWPLEGLVGCPVDVYAGGEDRNVPSAVAEEWATRLPHARLQRSPSAGHVSILPLVAERVLASVV
jgi:pimeloyl-ACP methyl ester carboxylesterase